MSSADFNKDMKDLINVRLAEIFKEHFSDSVNEEKVEEEKMFNELKEINKKIDNITSILENLQINGMSVDTSSVKQTRKTRTKKEDKVFIPDTDSNDMTFNSNSSVIQNISSNNINDALSALDNL